MEEAPRYGIDRRPIATRNRKWAQATTAWLASRNVSPNAISIAGMCACIIGGIALGLTSIVDYRILWLLGALGAQLRLTANMLDGMVAIASSRTSKTGELYNEVPDRISDAAVFIGAGFAWGGNVTLGYIATILAIFTAYVRAAGKIADETREKDTKTSIESVGRHGNDELSRAMRRDVGIIEMAFPLRRTPLA